MNFLRTGALSAFVAASLGLTALAGSAAYAATPAIVAQASMAPASATAPPPAAATPAPVPAPVVAPSMPPPDFGSPPSSEIPILFNDHHVYAKPDHLTGNRVLAAIIRHNIILVPMRSMFEQMGATVRYDASSKTVDVRKPGSDVRVTVGKPEVIVNNESRPLDVPPMLYRGSILVPLRVLSEGMGAYVQWIPDRRLVVVRYESAPVPVPPATEAPTAPPTVAPTPVPVPSTTPTPTRVKSQYEHFIVGDYIFSPKAYNELSPGNSGTSSFRAVAAIEFPLLRLPWMLEGDFRSFKYPHNGTGSNVCPTGQQGCVTAIGHLGQVYAPSFQARYDDFDGRFGLKVADPRIYIGVGYIFRNTNYEGGALPTQQHGVGIGVEKLPDLDEPFSLYGSIYYFPSVSTNASQDLGGGTLGEVQYRVLKYALGGTFDFGNSPIYADLGYGGERSTVKENASIGENYTGPYAGLGIHF